MTGYIEQVGASWAIYVEGELVAVRPDRESAEECLLKIVIFRQHLHDRDEDEKRN